MDKNFKHLSDEDLITYVGQGNFFADSELILRYTPYIMKRISRYSLPGVESEDLVQECLIGLMKAVKYYDKEKSKFNTFARICIESSVSTAVESALSNKSIPLKDYSSISEETEQSTLDNTYCSPEQTVFLQEQISEFYCTVEKILSPFENKVLTLHLDGYSYKTISHKLNTTPKAVDNAIQRIRRKLRPIYGLI